MKCAGGNEKFKRCKRLDPTNLEREGGNMGDLILAQRREEKKMMEKTN